MSEVRLRHNNKLSNYCASLSECMCVWHFLNFSRYKHEVELNLLSTKNPVSGAALALCVIICVPGNCCSVCIAHFQSKVSGVFSKYSLLGVVRDIGLKHERKWRYGLFLIKRPIKRNNFEECVLRLQSPEEAVVPQKRSFFETTLVSDHQKRIVENLPKVSICR